mgnify:CR=1 FL=1|jgi:hypothetical protein
MMQTIAAAKQKGGLTLGELADFIAQARSAGVPSDTVVKAVVTFGGKLRRIEVTSPSTPRSTGRPTD